MDVTMLRAERHKIEGTGSSRLCPVGWSGEVPDKVGKAWVKEGIALKGLNASTAPQTGGDTDELEAEVADLKKQVATLTAERDKALAEVKKLTPPAPSS